MLKTGTRRLVLVALAFGLVGLVRLWPGEPSVEEEKTSRPPSTDAAQRVVPAAPDRVDTAVDSVAVAGATRVPASTVQPSPRMTPATVRLQVHAPSTVQAGEILQARIDVEASGGVRELTFAVSYEKSRLALVGWSEGDFARQGGLPAELVAQEPSDGNIEVRFTVGNGLWVAGAGSLAMLQFEAIKAGTSGITLQDVTAIDMTGATDRNVAILREGSVTIH